MLRESSTLASEKNLAAFFHKGTLIVSAEGEKPSPCHEVLIEASMLPVEPPQFSLTLRSSPRPCPQVVTPYRVARAFRIGPARASIVVFHADGQSTVPVQVVDEYESSQTFSLAGGEVPVPYLLPRSASGAGVTPDERAAGCSSIGYSEAFDFTEALRGAIAGLPADPNPYPDKMDRIVVDEVGVEFGGFGGFHHLYVRVLQLPDPVTGKCP